MIYPLYPVQIDSPTNRLGVNGDRDNIIARSVKGVRYL